MSGLFQLLILQLKETSWLEWTGVVFGITEVLLARANKISLYPTGIIASVITIYLFWHSQLYAESLLNLYYVIMSGYGWWYWINRKNTPPVKISFTNKKEWLLVAGIVILGYAILYFILKNYTRSDVPHWDAWVTSTAWAGMWLLAKRKVENWVMLNISNALAVPLYFHKELLPYAFLTIILFAVAVQGYFEWRKKANNEAQKIT